MLQHRIILLVNYHQANVDIVLNYTDRDKEIIAVYNRSMGSAKNVFRFADVPESVPNPIYVMEFAPPLPEYDWIFATVGVSNKPMPHDATRNRINFDQRIELIIYARQHYDELPDLLAKLAVYPFYHKTFLAPGHTISGNGKGVVSGDPLTELLFTYPDSDSIEFQPIHHSDGTHTRLLFVVPLYPSEREFVRTQSMQDLEDRFFENKTDTSDLWRQPIV